jgi:hypothetical protein
MATSVNAMSLLRGIDQKSLSNARVYAFCFAIRALSFDLPPNGTVDSFYSSFTRNYPVANCITDWSCRALDSSVFRLGAMGPLWNEDRLMATGEWPVERDQIHAIALKALALLSIEVKSAVARGTLLPGGSRLLEQNRRQRSSEFQIPRSSRDIPFSSFMEIPAPYSPNSTALFATCHLPKMTTKSFIEDGEWSGVEFRSHTNHIGMSSVTSIHPLKLIATCHDPLSNVMELESRPLLGLEAQHHFRIRLKKSCGVSIWTAQSDVTSQSINWQGILTPFGFVGTTTLSPGEWFWLWKTSWSGKYQAKYDWTKLWGRGDINTVQQLVARLQRN